MYHRRGIPRFATGQAKALLKHPGLVRGLGLNPLRPFPDYLDPELLHSPLLDWTGIQSFGKASEAGPIAYYLTSPFELGPSAESLFPPFAMRPGIPLLATLYDLIPKMRPEHYLGDPDLAKSYKTRLQTIREVDLVLAISEHTRQDAISLLGLDPRRLFTIGAGVSEYFRPPEPGEDPAGEVARHLPAITRPFLLTVSGAEERKNTEGLLAAFGLLPPELRRELQLVVVCKLNDEYVRSWSAAVRLNGIDAEEVVFTDLIPDSTLRALYQTAQLFVFPSRYEGFGLPAAEAAACGCPTITSNTSSMPEILDFPPSTFDPSDPAEMAVRMQAALLDGELNTELRRVAGRVRSTHTWEDVARRTIEALSTLPEPKQAIARTAPRRLRLAFAGPFPPVLSGIADYDLRLVTELAQLCDLDVLVSAGAVDLQALSGVPGVRRFPLESLGKTLNPMSYDAVIYVLGNNEHHHITYEMALRYPGIVWLHDAQLSGLYFSYARDRLGAHRTRTFMAEKIQGMYRERTPGTLMTEPLASIDEFVDLTAGLTGELVTSARGVIVNSHQASRMVRLDLGPFAAVPPITVIPLAVPLTDQNVWGEPPAPVIGSFGIGGRQKGLDLLIAALALVRRQMPARLVLVGPITEDGLLDELNQQVHRLDLENFVELTGSVSTKEYRERLATVSCAVQIRSGSQGESSAAVNDCLGAGVPVITNMPYAAELPPGTVDLIHGKASPQVLAERILELLDDKERRKQYSQAGSHYARQASFPRTAVKIIEFAADLERSPL